jgi:hypothetical protein
LGQFRADHFDVFFGPARSPKILCEKAERLAENPIGCLVLHTVLSATHALQRTIAQVNQSCANGWATAVQNSSQNQILLTKSAHPRAAPIAGAYLHLHLSPLSHRTTVLIQHSQAYLDQLRSGRREFAAFVQQDKFAIAVADRKISTDFVYPAAKPLQCT